VRGGDQKRGTPNIKSFYIYARTPVAKIQKAPISQVDVVMYVRKRALQSHPLFDMQKLAEQWPRS